MLSSTVFSLMLVAFASLTQCLIQCFACCDEATLSASVYCLCGAHLYRSKCDGHWPIRPWAMHCETSVPMSLELGITIRNAERKVFILCCKLLITLRIDMRTCMRKRTALESLEPSVRIVGDHEKQHQKLHGGLIERAYLWFATGVFTLKFWPSSSPVWGWGADCTPVTFPSEASSN